MEYKKEKWNYQALEDILTDEQLNLLERWLGVNNLKYAEYQDDLLHGVTIYADHPINHESWSIDFVRSKGI